MLRILYVLMLYAFAAEEIKLTGQNKNTKITIKLCIYNNIKLKSTAHQQVTFGAD